MRFLPNGQWTLAKHNEMKEGPAPSSLHDLVGKTHTVEVHPHMDHLYRLKNHIQTQPKQTMPIRDIKKSEFGGLADKLPRDAKGNVTPEMIDKHIEKLPKHKVDVKVVPYKMGAQQHRDGVPQYVASVGFHPDTLKNMSSKEKATWKSMQTKQHDLEGHDNQVGWARIDPYKIDEKDKVVPNKGHWHIDEIQSDFGDPKRIDNHIKSHTEPSNIFMDIMGAAMQTANPDGPGRGNARDNQFALDPEAFARTYPELAPHFDNYKKSFNDSEEKKAQAHHDLGPGGTPQDDYWNKIGKIQDEHTANIKPFADAATDLSIKTSKDRAAEMVPANKMHDVMSHGHDDPMHMVHSAVNQLGRQNGIESMSMDTPNHQAHQSGLQPSNAMENGNGYDEQAHEQVIDHIQRGGVNDEQAQDFWQDLGHRAIANNSHDMHFKSATEKLGDEGLKQFASLVPKDSSSWMFNGHGDSQWGEALADNGYTKDLSPEVREKLRTMTDPEKDALSRFANDYSGDVWPQIANHLGINTNEDYGEVHPDEAEYDLPVHQINTYEKRPKKLGFQTVHKDDVLGRDPRDSYDKVQYAKLAKKLRLLQELLKKAQ